MKQYSRSRMAGVSLIELMISMVIGMLVVLVVVQLFAGNRTSSAAVQDGARIQEAGRSSFDFVARQIRAAGYHPVASQANFWDTNGGCVPTAVQPLCGVNDVAGAPNLSDEIVVRFWGSDGPTAGTADGASVDCAGNVLRANDIVEQRLRIENVPRNPANPASAEPTLVCRLISGAAAINAAAAPPQVAGALVPLAYGVETMQILYGEDTDLDLQPDRWRPANAVNMSRVRGVQVSLLLRGEGRGNVPKNYTYRLFGNNYAAAAGDAGSAFIDPQDGRLRQVASFSVNLRNRSN